MSGKEMLVHAREALRAAGAQEVGVEVMKVGSHALAGPIDKIKAAKPDVVVGCLMGEDVTDFLKQWKTAGMTGKIPFAQPSVNDADLYKAGAEAMTGIFTKTWHFADPRLSAEDKDFVAAYVKQFNGEMPSSDAWQTFMAIRSIVESIDKATSTEPAKVLAALRAFGRKSGPLTLAYRNIDHQMMHQIPILETKSQISHKLHWWDVETHYPEKLDSLDKLYGDAKQNGCKMPAA